MLIALVMLSAVLAMAKAIYLIDWTWWVIWLPAMCSFFVLVGALLFSVIAAFLVNPFKVTYR